MISFLWQCLNVLFAHLDGGIDTRIHGIKIMSCKEKEMGFNRDLLTPAKIAEFPLLDGYDVDTLYQKAIVMQRYVIWMKFAFKLMQVRGSAV
jgi:hypothetical protein